MDVRGVVWCVTLTATQWDQRTYKLLHTVPALDQCQIKFNHKGDTIFGRICDIAYSDSSNERKLERMDLLHK